MANQIIPPLDLMFFLTETPESPKHVGAVQVFRLPAGAPATYLRDLVAAFKAAPVIAPFNHRPRFPRLGLPWWEEVQDMEVGYHVRHSALPAPGTDQQLMEVVQRLHASLLDRRRPCWMCQVIEGLEGNRFAVYSKIHHAYIDGMSGVKRLYGSLSTSPSDKSVVPPWSFQPTRTPDERSRRRPRNEGGSGGKLLAQVKGLAGAYEFLTRMGLQLLKLRDGKAQVPFSAKRTRLNLPVQWDTRTTAICTFPLDEVRAIAHRRGCTLNEVVLAIIGAALHDYLEQHHEHPVAPLVAMCPMSLRVQGDDSAKTQVSAVHVTLGQPDAAIGERLDQVIESSRAAKEEVSELSAETMIDYGVIIFGLWELLARTGLEQFVAPSYNVLVSNVPGPGDADMYLNGSKMLASYPISTLLPGVNLNATLLSHGNCLDFGLLGDSHALPDLEIVAKRMEYHMSELSRLVLGAGKAAKPARQRAGTRKKPRPAAVSGRRPAGKRAGAAAGRAR